MTIPTLAEIKAHKPQIEAIAAQYGISNIRIFGSVARGDADAQSDVDILVDRKKKGLMALGGFKMDMEDLLGRKIDVVTSASLKHPLLGQRILSEATAL